VSAARQSARIDRLLGVGGIVGLTGENGSGKTSIAVDYAARYAAGGGRVLSTVAIEQDGVELIRSWDQVLEARDTLLLFDEVEVVASNRETMTLSGPARVALHTLRHRGCRLMWTAPTWLDVDTKLRRVTQYVVACAPRMWLGRGPSDAAGWPTTKVTRARRFRVLRDPLDPRPDAKVDYAASVHLARLASRSLFDTYAETVELPGSGDCPICELPRRRQFCTGRH